MEYPTGILPNSDYKYIDCDLTLHYLLRHSDLSLEEFYDTATRRIKLNAICHPKENIADLSTSLLGVFKIEHSRIRLTDKGKQKYNSYCEPDESIQVPLHEDYEVALYSNIWYVKIQSLQKIKVLYNRDEDEMVAECEIIHTPMKWNFWHFSIRWKTENIELSLGKNPRKWEQRLCNAARNALSEIITINEPTIFELPIHCYKKS